MWEYIKENNPDKKKRLKIIAVLLLWIGLIGIHAQQKETQSLTGAKRIMQAWRAGSINDDSNVSI